MISVILPVYNGGKYIKYCLEAISSCRNEYEIIVVDDGSDDNTTEICKNFNVRLLENIKRRGAAFSRNAGAACANGNILLFVDADVLIKPDTIDKISIFFKDHSTVSAVFGSYDDEPADKGFFSQYKNLAHHFFHQTGKRNAMTFWTGCGAVRRTAFLDINGFDENLSYMEDIELGYRLNSKGYEVVLLPHLQVKHLKGFTCYSMIYTDIFSRAVPWTYLLLKHPSVGHTLNLALSQKFSAFFAFIILVSAIASVFSLLFLIVCLVSVLSILFINYAYYQYFLKKKGFWFTISIIPFHILYYWYSSAVFVVLSVKDKTEKAFKALFPKSNFSYNNL